MHLNYTFYNRCICLSWNFSVLVQFFTRRIQNYFFFSLSLSVCVSLCPSAHVIWFFSRFSSTLFLSCTGTTVHMHTENSVLAMTLHSIIILRISETYKLTKSQLASHLLPIDARAHFKFIHFAY